MTLAQTERPMRLTTPLGGDTLVIEKLAGLEHVSRPFELKLDLLSEDAAIDPTKLLRKPVGVTVQLEGGGERYFHGWVRRFVQGARDEDQLVDYHAEVVPWFWFLSTTSNCRIFQQMSVPDIVKKVFGDRSMTDYKLSLSGSYAPREYCVQYRESDMDFVSRLLEEEGIFYYFEHAESKHTMVIADSPSAIKSGPLAKMSAASSGPGTYGQEYIVGFELGSAFFSGSVGLDDYNMETPSLNLLQKINTTVKGVDNSAFKLFDYPGKYAKVNEGERVARLRMEEQEASSATVTGAAMGAAMACGTKVEVADFYRRDANKPYLVTSVQHTGTNASFRTATAGAAYLFTQSFEGIPAAVVFRPPRITPKAIVRGAQTAVVVGPAGDEIYVDKYGRVKVQFFWDQEGKKNENSSCFIRVSSAWAGKQWGFIQIPRIGQEVIVDFLEGDPDRPIIVGRVYNAEQMPPYTLPDNMTQSGGKSRSSKGGSAADFNEFRFEDKKGAELVTLHAQKDSSIEVEHDETHWIGNDRTKNVDHDETVHVKNNRTETVDNNETITIHGGRTEVVDKDESIAIHQNRTETVDKDESLTVSGNRTRTVSKDETVSIGQAWSQSVGKDATVDISGKYSVSINKDRSVTVSGGDSLSINEALSAKAGTSITIEANSGITLKCGQSQIKIDQSGVQITGLQVKVEGEMTTEVKGGMMAKLDGGAMCTVKGAVTMIN
jgi:type VI secretion system secreted protein VgrG